jgi:His/Glu/Gln/Arg/opine family amino acid ABC transporter permease subunit
MNRRWTAGSRRVLSWVVPLALVATLGVLAAPVSAHALSMSGSTDGLTLDQQTGNQLIRYTLEATEESSDTISAISLTFPKGFDLSESKVEALTIQLPLTRVPVKYTVSITGQTVRVVFKPSLKPSKVSTDLRVTVNDVFTPHKGGTYPLGVTYETNGITKTVSKVTFSYATPTIGEDISTWMDGQKWVSGWNSVQFFNLFLQPQMAAVAFTTVWAGWLISLGLVILAFPLAIVGGLALAFMKMSKVWPLRWIASAYVNVVRGTPLFLQISIVFVGLPIAGLSVQWFAGGVLVLALNSSAYLAEIFRAGIQSISKGQFEAASSLGMTYPQAMANVIIPQTVKRVLPTMTSEFILLFKDTALLSAVGVFELMLYSNNLVARSGNITPFMVAAVYYLIVTVPLINVVGRLEAKLAQSEGGQTPVAPSKRGRTFWQPAAAGPATALEASSVEHESR